MIRKRRGLREAPPSPKGKRIALLDLGSEKVRCIIAEAKDDEELTVAGYGESASEGIRRGEVVELASASSSVERSVAAAESAAGYRPRYAVMAVSGTHIIGVESCGTARVTPPSSAVSPATVRQAIAKGANIVMPAGREVIDRLVRRFVLDGTFEVKNPIGMKCHSVSAELLIITAASASVENLKTVVGRCGMRAARIVSAPYATGVGVLDDEERELGAAVIDIGAEATHVFAVRRDEPRVAFAVPVGGRTFTSDVAEVFGLAFSTAEKVKRLKGTARRATLSDDEAGVVLGEVRTPPGIRFDRGKLAEVLEARAGELFTIVRRRSALADCRLHLGKGIVLAGGGSRLAGMVQKARDVFALPVRVSGVGFGAAAGEISGPEFGLLRGLMKLALRPSEPCTSAASSFLALMGESWRRLVSSF